MRTTLEQRYRFTDVLGSTVALTDAFGAIEFAESRMGFDAWGQRRDPVTGLPLSGASAAGFPVRDTTDRGYTGQRHEDSAGLVHLGARWYDPVTGRFVQADSIIGEAGNSQAYNFYSYALNNPLAYTDPSGHWGQQEQAYLRAAVAIVIAAYTGWYIGAAELTGSAAIGTAALGGAAAGAVASGNLRGAVTGAFSGMLFYGIGTGFTQANADWAYNSVNSLNTAGWAAKTAAHGFAGGIMAELEGDKFGHGFVAAGFTQSMSGVIGRMPNPGSRIVVAAVVGGTASELSGGKFANGAVTAGFSNSLNECAHGGCWTSREETDALAKGRYLDYYDKACDGGDGYACAAGPIAKGETTMANLTTFRLQEFAALDRFLDLLSPQEMGEIRLKLARRYADYLGYEESNSMPKKKGRGMAIARIHWKTFGEYGIRPAAIGGTPFGRWYPEMFGPSFMESYPPRFGESGWCRDGME